jgi:hypothetical protein
MPDLREAWSSHIQAMDYDVHMAAVGQAQANADLLAELFRDHPPPAGSRVHIAGAGTGQYFDYFPPDRLAPYRMTFTDINPLFLARFQTRWPMKAEAIGVDDIEAPTQPGPYDLTIAILVLEHIDWRRAITAMCARTARAFVVIQEDPPEPLVRPLPGSMAILREALPHLVSRDELIEAFRAEGFELSRTSTRDVPDGKRMIGLDFTGPR